MEKQISTAELAVGMFVSNLDRPWLDTPFLIQGFLIEDEETLLQLQATCQHVTVDFARSALEEKELAGSGDNRPAVAPLLSPENVVPLIERAGEARQSPYQATNWFARILRTLKELVSPKDKVSRQAPNTNESAAKRVPVGNYLPPANGIENPRLLIFPDELAVPLSTQAKPGHASPLQKGLFHWLRGLLFWRSAGRAKPGEPHAPGTSWDARDFRIHSDRAQVYERSTRIENEIVPAARIVAHGKQILQRVIRDIRLNQGLEIEAVEEVAESLCESIIRNPDAVQLIVQLQRDSSAYTRALLVGVMCASMGRELGLNRSELVSLGQVGMLLDIGKLRIDRAILDKAGKLTPKEFQEIKRHVPYGLEMIAAAGQVHPDVIGGVAQHHERLNGSGYPQGLKKSQIGIFGQIAGIIDTFCALTSSRPFALLPMSAYDAMRQLKDWGNEHFNENLVEQFIQGIGIFPVGTLVELSTGEVAVVAEQHKSHRLKPKLLVLTTPGKEMLKVPVSLDLLFGTGSGSEHPPYIRRGLPAESVGLDPVEYYLSRSRTAAV